MTMILIYCIIFLLTHSIQHGTATEQCRYVDYLGKEFNAANIGCSLHNICNENRAINVTYIETPPYFYAKMKNDENKTDKNVQKPVHQLLRRCCGTCANINQLPILKSLEELTPGKLEESDFIYPVLTCASKEQMFGYYYIPLVDVPGLMYMSESPYVYLAEIFYHVFPICLVAILLCLVAGFVCWIMETWSNEEEFPRCFLIGWCEGFWWAFVSMTTVGYGDKSPKSILGRMFSLFWITIGIIAYGILTGIVFTEITKANSPPPADMQGKNVGSLLFRDYDALMISENGGRSVRNNDRDSLNHPYSDFLNLVEKLERKEIDGIAVDQFTLLYVYWSTYAFTKGELALDIAKPFGWIEDRAKFIDKLVTVKVPQTSSSSFAYGILVKRHKDYIYLKSAAGDLRHTIRRLWSEEVQFTFSFDRTLLYTARNELYSYKGMHFKYTVITIALMVSFICIFGVAYEMIRRKSCGKYKGRTVIA